MTMPVFLSAAPARSRVAQWDAFPGAMRGLEDATHRARSLPKESGHRGVRPPGWRRKGPTLRICLSPSKLIPCPQADDIAARRRADNRGTFEMTIFQREFQIGARAIDRITGIGAIPGQILIGGFT